MKTTDIAFIVIAYRPDMAMLNRLLYVLPSFQTVVVDNGQTLDTEHVGKATLLSQTSNQGYAVAANIGIHHAIARGAEWFVILNQDVRLTRKAVLSLMKKLTKLDPCVAGPFTAGLDRKRWTTILPSKHTDYVTGSCLAIHSKAFEKAGYLYEPYFLYYEDADYCIRVKKSGLPIRRIDISGISHEETKSLGKGSFLHQYYMARNHLLFVWRLAPKNVRRHEVLRMPKTIAEHIVRHEKGALIGVRDFFLKKTGAYQGAV